MFFFFRCVVLESVLCFIWMLCSRQGFIYVIGVPCRVGTSTGVPGYRGPATTLVVNFYLGTSHLETYFGNTFTQRCDTAINKPKFCHANAALHFIPHFLYKTSIRKERQFIFIEMERYLGRNLLFVPALVP